MLRNSRSRRERGAICGVQLPSPSIEGKTTQYQIINHKHDFQKRFKCLVIKETKEKTKCQIDQRKKKITSNIIEGIAVQITDIGMTLSAFWQDLLRWMKGPYPLVQQFYF